MSNRFLTTSGSYPDLDRFNRVTTSRWTRDLATDRHFYQVELDYDRNGGIDWLQDVVWPGRDVLYSNDSHGRLLSALEGTVSSGSLITATRTEAWTLSQTGNWHERTLDLDGDGFFTGSGELFDCGTFNNANEWTKRDTDCDTTDDVTMVYDAVGNLTDDGVSYTFEYDPFGRMRKVRNRTTTDLVAEYRYNGLGYRIGWHYDVDVDNDVDGSDPWFYFVYDDAWRQVATFRENDTNAKEVFVPHMAGMNGRGGSSALDAVIMRDKDANTAWGTAMDGTREERMYYCQNWRGDVVNLLKVMGGGAVQVAETVRYSSYGVPFSIPPGDVNGDGVVDLNDTWPGSYTVRCDYDLDGDVDFDDENIHVFATATLGRGILSDLAIGNRRGYCGYEHDGGIDVMCHVRNRVLLTELGRWTRRDPSEYDREHQTYRYCHAHPIVSTDSLGLRPNPTSSEIPAGLDDNSSCKNYPCDLLQGPCIVKMECGRQSQSQPGTICDHHCAENRTVLGFATCDTIHPGGVTTCCVCDTNIINEFTAEAAPAIENCTREHEQRHLWYCQNCPERHEDCQHCKIFGHQVFCLINALNNCQSPDVCHQLVRALANVATRQARACAACELRDQGILIQ